MNITPRNTIANQEIEKRNTISYVYDSILIDKQINMLAVHKYETEYLVISQYFILKPPSENGKKS